MINALVPDIRSKGLSKDKGYPWCDPTQRHGAGGAARLPRPARPAAAGPRQHRRQGAQRA